MAAPTLFQTPLAARNGARLLPPVQVDIVVPVYNEAGGARAQHPPPPPLPRRRVPVHLADRDRRQREHRRDARDRPLARRVARRRAGAAARAQGPRAGAARRLVGQRRPRRRVHGRRPVDRPARPAAAGRAAALRPLRPRHRHAAGPRRPRRAGPQARADLARLQPCCCTPRCAPASPTPSAASRPCGARRSTPLLAEVRDDAWFFDTELLVLAQRRGLRIHEVPVDWIDDPDSRVGDRAHGARRPAGRRAADGLGRSSASWRSAWRARSPTRCCTWRSAARSAPAAPTRSRSR